MANVSCTACDLHKQGLNMVCAPAKGTPESGLFIIADRPSFSEDSRMSSFSSPAYKLLFDLINKAQIPFPDGCYLTYATKCFFPETAPKELKRQSTDICNETWLKKEILKYKPKIIVTLGAEVMTFLTGVSGVMKHRGTIIDTEIDGQSFKILPTLAPAYLLSEHRELETQVISDLKRAYSSVHTGISCWSPDKLKELKYRTVKNQDDFDLMIREIKEKGVVASDIETRGKDPYRKFEDGFPLVSIQFSTAPKTGWFLPISHESTGGLYWTESEFNYIKTGLKEILETDIFLIGHNFKFDSKWIYKWLGIKPKLCFDTMLAHGLFEETSSSLKKLSWSMTDMGGYEEEQNKITEDMPPEKRYDMYYYPFQTLATYGCCDVDVTYRIFEILNEKLKTNDQLRALFKTLIKASRAFLDIEHDGMKINTDQLSQLAVDLDLEIKKLSEDFRLLATPQIAEIEAELLKEAVSQKTGKILKNKITEFNIDSSDHICHLFYDKLGMPINDRHRSKKTQEPSVGRKVLEELSVKYPIAKLLIDYRTLSKQKVAFVDAYPRFIDNNSRIHPTYSLIKYFDEDSDKESGTSTGRLSCKDPNLQQVPSRDEDKRIKKIFIPDCSDHYIMDCDFSGIELRVTAMVCQDPVMKKFFNEGTGDFHRYVASKVYGKPEDQISKLERTYAKSTTFGILYGAGPSKIAEQVKCSIKDAQNFIDEYFKLFPTLKKWITQQKTFAQRNLYVKSMFGRIRQLPDANSPNEFYRESALRRAVNTPIQADASDITLYSLTRIYSYLNKFNHTDINYPSKLKGSVHDSILLSVHKDDFSEIAEHIKFNILEKIDLDFLLEKGVQLAAEVSIGTNWGSVVTLES